MGTVCATDMHFSFWHVPLSWQCSTRASLSRSNWRSMLSSYCSSCLCVVWMWFFFSLIHFLWRSSGVSTQGSQSDLRRIKRTGPFSVRQPHSIPTTRPQPNKPLFLNHTNTMDHFDSSESTASVSDVPEMTPIGSIPASTDNNTSGGGCIIA